ncbi:MAG TPA: hypothetical protein VFF16_09070 [Telluria sp.]|nr:hypothetical protein [Telluria sp.]
MQFDLNAARLRLAACAAAALATAQANAARPLVTDDARIVDPHACQLETWSKVNHGSTEYWALPACNMAGGVELALGGARTREGGRSTTSDLVVQAKFLLQPLETNGWGIGLAVGAASHPHAGTGQRDWYVNVPASLSINDDAVALHANGGWLRDGASGAGRLTWGLGAEARCARRSWLIAETFGQDRGAASYQLGLRHWLVPERVQLDATFGNRQGGGSGARWLSLGLRLLAPPFLR